MSARVFETGLIRLFKVWAFRTRSGFYRQTNLEDSGDRRAEQILADNLMEIKRQVLEGADIKVVPYTVVKVFFIPHG